jgi:hypothetical protein
VNPFLKFLGLFGIVIFGISCSFMSTSPETNYYHIDYSSGGGFTGIVSGMTIRSDGSVQYWEKKINSSPTITDSTVLTSTQRKSLNKLMQNKEIFSYKNDYKGNYSAFVTFSNDSNSNKFSFNPSNIPKEMPDVIKNIITEIKNISNHP